METYYDPQDLEGFSHVATAIRGGASLVHGVQMRKIAERISL